MHERDRLFVSDTSAYLKDSNARSARRSTTSRRSATLPAERIRKLADDQQLVEVVVTEDSPLQHRRSATSASPSVSAWSRSRCTGRPTILADGEIPDRELRSGDVLLTQGPPARINALKLEAGLLVLDGTLDLPRTRKAPIAIAIMARVVVTAAMNVLPISLASVLGVLALLVTGCLKFDGLGRGISAEVVLIVVVEPGARPRVDASRAARS